MLFDSHTHLNFKAFNEDRAEVMTRCRQAGLSAVNVGAAYDTSQKAVEIAEEKFDIDIVKKFGAQALQQLKNKDQTKK